MTVSEPPDPAARLRMLGSPPRPDADEFGPGVRRIARAAPTPGWFAPPPDPEPPAADADRSAHVGPPDTGVGPVSAGFGSPHQRAGWPTAPPGTPAARLRLPPPEPPPVPWPERWREREPAGNGDRAARLRPPPLEPELDPEDDGDDGDWAEEDPQWAPPPSPPGRLAERWLPASWRDARWDPGRLGAVALAAVAAVAAVVAAVGVWSARPVPEAVPALPVVADARPAAAAAAPGAPLVVSVSGKVRRPGLVRLAGGARVGDAVDAAGGATPGADTTGLNLAARVADGEQVVVGVPAPAPSVAAAAPSGGGAAPSGGGAGPAPGGKVDLNQATLEQLDGLPGVGPATAKKILDWRTQNGRFATVDQLREVNGIGDARFATLRDLVTV